MNQFRLILKSGQVIDRGEQTMSPLGPTRIFAELTKDYLWIRNTGKGDPWTAGGQPEPLYNIDLYLYCPGYRPEIAEWTGMVEVLPDTWRIYQANQAKMPHPHALTIQAYADSMAYHMIDGGESIFIRLVPTVGSSFVEPLLSNKHKAEDILNLDYTRINKWPWLQNITDYIFDPVITTNPPVNNHRHIDMMNPVSYAKRTGIADSPSDYANLWQFGTREPGTGVRLEYYDMDLGYFINYLRTGNLVSLQMFRTLVEQKIARGFYDNDDPTYKYRYCLNGEHYRGGVLVPQDPLKDWDLDIIIANALWPDNPIIKNCFEKRVIYNVNRNNAWNGSGGARILGRYLHNLWDYYKATGDSRFADRARSEITHAFTIVGAANYFRETEANKSSAGEGQLALSGVCRWVFDGPNRSIARGGAGGLEQYESKVRSMIDVTMSQAGYMVSPGKFKAHYYYYPNTPTFQDSGEQQALSWTQLAPYLTATQQATLDAAENYMYNIYPSHGFGIDYGQLYPSTVKWVGFAIESMRR